MPGSCCAGALAGVPAGATPVPLVPGKLPWLPLLAWCGVADARLIAPMTTKGTMKNANGSRQIQNDYNLTSGCFDLSRKLHSFCDPQIVVCYSEALLLTLFFHETHLLGAVSLGLNIYTFLTLINFCWDLKYTQHKTVTTTSK